MESLAQLHLVGNVALAVLLGGIIGVEREIADKPAGFRTHMLVAGASALLMNVGDVVMAEFGGSLEGSSANIDPTRIIQAIVTGISFLGAGTIIRGRSEEGVEGLTTAATILLAAAVGICVAMEQIILAGGATAIGLGVLVGMKFVSRRIERVRDNHLKSHKPDRPNSTPNEK